MLTVFVHGFNNDEWQALKKWDKIWRSIKSLTRSQTGGIILFFWPGDANSIVKVFGAQYPRRIKPAISAGAELGKFLRDIVGSNPGLRVQFVGHSLGCRVVLSAISELAKDPQSVPVVRVLLMGAAVPAGDCEEGGPWPDTVGALFGPAHGLESSRKSDVILHSLNDEILGTKFLLAEAAAKVVGVESSGGEAVGLRGGPSPVRWTGEIYSQGLKHSAYLTHPKALGQVAELFGPLVSRQLVKRSEGTRVLGEQQLDQRQLPSVPKLG